MPRCSQRTAGWDTFRQDRRRALRTSSGMTGWSWWRGVDRRTLFRLAWQGYAPGRGSSFVSSSSGSTPPSRCCSCLRRISCIKAASRASSSTPGSWRGFSPELPGGCPGSPMARFSSNPESLAQYPARSIVLRDCLRLSCPATSAPTGSSGTPYAADPVGWFYDARSGVTSSKYQAMIPGMRSSSHRLIRSISNERSTLPGWPARVPPGLLGA